jgi:O-methyltransferase
MKKLFKNIFETLGLNIRKVSEHHHMHKAIFKKYVAFTMIPEAIFLKNLELVLKFSKAKGVVVECGVWRGGMSAGISEIIPNKTFHLFDSFEGLPDVKAIDGLNAKAWQDDKDSPNYFNNCKAEMEEAQKAMDMAKASYELHKGWFVDTLPDFNEEIAILRLDGDWYDSTMECLKNLFPLVTKNGLIIIDDYTVWDGCSRAVHDYLSENKLASKIKQFDNTVAYIIKEDIT